jgi:hypothetical protein
MAILYHGPNLNSAKPIFPNGNVRFFGYKRSFNGLPSLRTEKSRPFPSKVLAIAVIAPERGIGLSANNGLNLNVIAKCCWIFGSSDTARRENKISFLRMRAAR